MVSRDGTIEAMAGRKVSVQTFIVTMALAIVTVGVALLAVMQFDSNDSTKTQSQLEAAEQTAPDENETSTTTTDNSVPPTLTTTSTTQTTAAAISTTADSQSESKSRETIASNGKPVVHLTFDDGPSDVTPGLLALLKTNNAQATFFVRGDTVEANRELTKQIVADGHAIANHGYLDHTPWQVNEMTKERITKTQGLIESTTGIKPKCARPPLGAINPGVPEMLTNDYGLALWNWDLDSADSRAKDEGSVRTRLDSIASQTNRLGAEGVVVLQHDAAGFGGSIQALEGWLGENADKYQFKAIDGCL